MKKDYVCKDSELATEGATDLWEGSLIDQLITEVILSSHPELRHWRLILPPQN